MVLIPDGNSEHGAHMRINRSTGLYKTNFQFATALDLKKCLKQIKIPISLHTCAPMSELL